MIDIAHFSEAREYQPMKPADRVKGKFMRRREFITLLGGAAAAWPLAAGAQQDGRVRWMGVLQQSPDGDPVGRAIITDFEARLQSLGWTVGRNLAIDYRWGANDLERARTAIAQVLRLPLDVILVQGGPSLMAAQLATDKIPIVFVGVSEPVERGYVASLARPGGNSTGFTNLEATMGGKWLELLREIAPRVTRVAAIFHPGSSFAVLFVHAAEAAARKLGVEVVAAHVRNSTEINAALATLAGEAGAGLMLPPDGFTGAFRTQILEFTTRHRLPLIAQSRSFVADGGLMSYGSDNFDTFRRAATYVDRILRGEKPADLPIQNPIKFELVINMKTAKALGLTVPLTLQVAADEVIE
jgi:putative tryptophan/tyrosine transport system substrate-binding protein